MRISFENINLIHKIATNLSEMRLDPVLFLENYLEFKSPYIFEAQQVTNWWQNIKNLMGGGYEGYVKGQVDVERKYKEAKAALETIVNIIKTNKANIADDRIVGDVLSHLDDVVSQLNTADSHIGHIGKRLQQFAVGQKVAGAAPVSHTASLSDDIFKNLPIISSLRSPSLTQLANWYATKIGDNQRKDILNLAKYQLRRSSTKLQRTVTTGMSGGVINALAGVGVADRNDQLAIMVYLLLRYKEQILGDFDSLDLPAGADLSDKTVMNKIGEWIKAENSRSVFLNRADVLPLPTTPGVANALQANFLALAPVDRIGANKKIYASMLYNAFVQKVLSAIIV